jgi:formylglycine-generating enzyme required for sulfatase activity
VAVPHFPPHPAKLKQMFRTPILSLLLTASLAGNLFAQTPALSLTNLTEGQVATVAVSNCGQGDAVIVAASFYGPGPTLTAFGFVDLTPPLKLFPTMLANASGVASMNYSVPIGTGGTAVWLQAVNASNGTLSNSLAEVVAYNNPPIVTSILPNQADQGAPVALTVSGSDFLAGAEIELVSPTLTIQATGGWFGHSTLVGGDFDLSGVPAGQYSVKVINPTGLVGTLVNGFEVLQVAPLVTGGLRVCGLENETYEIRVTGDFFDAGAQLTLIQGNHVIDASAEVVHPNGIGLVATVHLAGPLGRYDVRVTDPDGLWGEIPQGFEIQDLPVGEVFIPAGGFQMGDHFGLGSSDELPVHGVALSAFWIDKYEVTNVAYASFLNEAFAAGKIRVWANKVYQFRTGGEMLCSLRASDSASSITWDGTTFEVLPNMEIHPASGITWFGAASYANAKSVSSGLQPCYNPTTWACDFNADGYRLPTEAEWEYAARGNTPTYSAFPWGNTINGSQANFSGSGDPYDEGTTPCGYYDGNQIPNGVNMANGFGLYDMNGNISEWCHDKYDPTYYSWGPSFNPTGTNAANAPRVHRGGSWSSQSNLLRSAARTSGGHRGFRLASGR